MADVGEAHRRQVQIKNSLLTFHTNFSNMDKRDQRSSKRVGTRAFSLLL
jgi:hypothetical protein